MRAPVSSRRTNINTGNINTGDVNVNTGSSYNGGHHHHYDHHHGDDWGYGSWHYGDDWPYPGLGLAALGLGLAIGSDDDDYEYKNPYAPPAGTTNVYYNYAQPIAAPPTQVPPSGTTTVQPAPAGAPGAAQPPAAQPPAGQDVNPQAMQAFEAARQAFGTKNYAEAQRQVETAIQLMPDDSILHEFRALTLFAQGKYADASAAIYAVLAAGPPWDWQTIQVLYGDVNAYTQQLRKLEQHIQKNPKEAEGRFLLAYQYLCIGDGNAALKQFQEVTKLEPTDQLSAALVKQLQGSQGSATAPAPSPPK